VSRPRVLVWAHLGDGGTGGVQTVILGLAQGFRDLGDFGIDLVWFTKQGDDDWLRAELPHGSRIVHAKHLRFLPKATGFTLRRIGRTAEALEIRNSIISDRFMRGSSVRPAHLAVDLVHFTAQSSFFTGGIPFIYQPHDLQHEYFPEYFTRRVIASRRMMYGANIRAAALTIVGSESTSEDVKRTYPERADHVMVVPLAPVELPDPAPLNEAQSASLPGDFALYPAAAWPHKNHRTLFQALKILKDRGLGRPVVLTGARTGQVNLTALAREVGVDDLVTHLGFVDPGQLATLYRRARLTVVPTLFEAGSFPMFEAFQSGCPVVASHVCSLPSQAAGAAVMIDPLSPSDLAEKLNLVWTDDSLRATLAVRGLERANQFTWRTAAQGYAAAYRRALGLPAAESDLRWMRTHARF